MPDPDDRDPDDRIGQADDNRRELAVAGVDLDLDGIRINPVNGAGIDSGQQSNPLTEMSERGNV